MATTYEPIATTTLGSAAASITFSSIPATYTDLRLIYVVQGTAAGQLCFTRFNGDTSGSTLYSLTNLYGDGTSATSSANTSRSSWFDFQFGMPSSGNTFAFGTIDIFSYAGSTFKTGLLTGSNDANGSGDVDRRVGLYRSTSAITSITLTPQVSGNFAIGSTATLYGIKNA
jgi:hypothetical protein